MPELSFTESDPAVIENEILSAYEAAAGRSLVKGDPVRLFLLTIAAVIVQQRVLINYAAKQNLLAYAAGDNLDHIGVLVGAERLPATAARTRLRITLAQAREKSTPIPAGVRVTAGDNVLFMTAEVAAVPTGETEIEIAGECVEKGVVGNGYAAGELNKIVDPQPFVSAIVNVTATEGGSDAETDEAYRQRIRQAPESFSCAGPAGAYEYHARQASALIEDVSVASPSPGCVEVRPLLADGTLPGEEILHAVDAALQDSRVRPLTDKVSVLVPEAIAYDIDLTYWIDRADVTNAAAIQAAVENAVSAYTRWQKVKLGRDINPSELIYRLRQAGAKRAEVRAPAFTAVTAAQVATAGKITVAFGGMEDG